MKRRRMVTDRNARVKEMVVKSIAPKVEESKEVFHQIDITEKPTRGIRTGYGEVIG